MKGFQKGHPYGKRFIKGCTSIMKGKKHSEESKKKMSLSHKGQVAWNKGMKGYNAGEKSGLWKGGITKKPDYNYIRQKQWVSENRDHKNYLSHKRKLQILNIEGSHTLEEWKNLKKLYGNMCLCCKRTEPEITLSEDHIIPISKGGTDYIYNIQPLCRSCNSIKKANIIDYRKEQLP